MAKWRTHNICPQCKNEFLKTELIDGICQSCKNDKKKAKMSRRGTKIVTKQKKSLCYHCTLPIQAGKRAVFYTYEHFFQTQYGYMHEDCVEFTD